VTQWRSRCARRASRSGESPAQHENHTPTTHVLYQAVCNAVANGTTVVVSAGNDGGD